MRKTVRNVMAATHCSVFVFKRVYCLPSLGVAGMVDVWLWLDEQAIFQSASKNVALQLEEELERNVWDSLEDDKWALVSDESEQYHYETRENASPASSTVGVAGMVAEWKSLDERLIFQSVSWIISLQLEEVLELGVWEDDTWALCSLFLKADVHKILLVLFWRNTKIHSALWHVVRSWSLVVFPKFKSPMPQEIVRTVVTSAWPRSVPELCHLTLFSLSCLLQPARGGRFDGAMWIFLTGRCQHVTRNSTAATILKNQGRSKRETKPSNTCLWNVRDSLNWNTNQMSVAPVAPCPRKARASPSVADSSPFAITVCSLSHLRVRHCVHLVVWKKFPRTLCFHVVTTGLGLPDSDKPKNECFFILSSLLLRNTDRGVPHVCASFSGVSRHMTQGVETCVQVSHKSHPWFACEGTGVSTVGRAHKVFFFAARTKESNTCVHNFSVRMLGSVLGYVLGGQPTVILRVTAIKR